MPVQAQTSVAVREPETPYDKLRYSLVVQTSIDAAGNFKARGNYEVRRCRVLSTGQWEDDPTSQPVVRSADWFALAAQYPEVAAAMAAINAAVAAVNADRKLA